jgi:hypothetical protein
MIQQGRRKLFSAEEKMTYLQMFKEQGGGDFTRFAQKCDVPVKQFRLWLQLSESGLELHDSKPLPIKPKGNGKAIDPDKTFVDAMTRTYWSQQLLRARLNGRDKVQSLEEAFVKATGFNVSTISRWTREYTETPRGRKFEKKLQPKPAPKVKAKGPGRPRASRYVNPATGKGETSLKPEYWEKLVGLVTALDNDLRIAYHRLAVQSDKLDELIKLWK